MAWPLEDAGQFGADNLSRGAGDLDGLAASALTGGDSKQDIG